MSATQPLEDWIAAAAREVTPAGLLALMDAAARKAGFEYIVYGQSSRRPQATMASEIVVPAFTYPAPWMSRYLERNYAAIDAVVRAAVTSGAPFAWRSVPAMVPFGRPQQAVFDEAGDFGLRSGITVPIHRAAGEVDIMSFARTNADACEPETPYQLQAIATVLTSRWREITGGPNEADPAATKLTDRECECLMWTACGKSSEDIADILDIRSSTVNFHLRNAMQKLNASTRLLAVVMAIRRGLIRP